MVTGKNGHRSLPTHAGSIVGAVFGVVFGVIPEFQGRGMEGALIMELAKRIQVTAKYENFLLTWIGDFNPKMIHLVESMGTHKERVLYTYRKLFDEHAEFERAPIIK